MLTTFNVKTHRRGFCEIRGQQTHFHRPIYTGQYVGGENIKALCGGRGKSGVGLSERIQILKEVDADDAFANLALNKILEKYQPAKLDRAFATELTYGTLRTLNTLDWLLSKFLKKTVNCANSLDPQHLENSYLSNLFYGPGAAFSSL